MDRLDWQPRLLRADEIACAQVLSARTACVLLEYVERLYDAALLDYGGRLPAPWRQGSGNDVVRPIGLDTNFRTQKGEENDEVEGGGSDLLEEIPPSLPERARGREPASDRPSLEGGRIGCER